MLPAALFFWGHSLYNRPAFSHTKHRRCWVIRFFMLFFICAFAGFLLETGFALFTKGRLENRKTMYLLPLCPVYGVGGVALIAVLEPFRNHWLLTALLGAACATVVEYIYGFLALRIFKVWIWDYRQVRWHLDGLICLPFTVAWGMLAAPFISYVAPVLTRISFYFPPAPAWLLAGLFAIDCICTVRMLRSIGSGRPDIACPVIQPAN